MRDWLVQKGPEFEQRILLALVFGVPIIFLRNVNDPINIPKLALLAVGLAVVGGSRLGRIVFENPSEGLKRLLLPAGAIFLPLLLGWAFSDDPGWALMGHYPRYLGLVPYALTILFGVLVADAFARDARPVAWALVVAGAVAGAYAVIQVADLDPLSWAARGTEVRTATSTLGNTNFTGGFLAIVTPLALALWLLDPARRLQAGVCGGLMLVGLGVSGSEGGYAAALVGLLLTGAFLVGGAKRIFLLAAAAVTCAGVIGVVALGIADPGAVPGTIELRGRWWRAAVDIVADSPVVGEGPSTFALEHSQHRTLEDVETTGLVVETDPHSVPLSLAVGAGLLGFAGFVYAIFWLIRAGLAAARASLLAAGFLGAVGAYVTQALVSIDTVALRSTFWAAAGALVATAAPEVATKTKRRVGNRKTRAAAMESASPRVLVGIPLIVIGVLLTAAWATRLVTADARYQDAAQRHGGSVEEVRADYEAALGKREEVTYRAGYGSFLGDVAVQLAEQGGEDEADLLIEEANEQFSFTTDLPDVRLVTAHARMLRAWAVAHPDAAGGVIRLYRRAVSLDPLNVNLLAEAAEAAVELGDEPSAQQFKDRAQELRD